MRSINWEARESGLQSLGFAPSLADDDWRCRGRGTVGLVRARCIVGILLSGVFAGLPPLEPALQSADSAVVAPRVAKVFARGNGELYGIRAIAPERDAAGLWVIHRGDVPPVRINRQTGRITVIGARGAGPREYLRADALVTGPHSTVGVYDPELARLAWADSTGAHASLWPAPPGVTGGAMFADEQGGVYFTKLIPQPVTLGGGTRSLPTRWDSAGPRDTIAIPLGARRPRGLWTAGGGRMRTGIPESPGVVWTIDARGRILAAWQDSNFVLVRDGSGERRLLLPQVRDPLPDHIRSAAEGVIANFRERAKAAGMTPDGPPPNIPAFRWQIAALVPNTDGGVAVVRNRVCSRIAAWRAPTTGRVAGPGQLGCPVVERFDAEGRRLTAFTIDFGAQLWAMKGDTAWAVRAEGFDGFQSIVEYVVPTPAKR